MKRRSGILNGNNTYTDVKITTKIPVVLPDIPTTGTLPPGGIFTSPEITVDREGRITNITEGGGGPSGDVVGPAGSNDGDVALFDGVTGKLLKRDGDLNYDTATDTLRTGNLSVPTGNVEVGTGNVEVTSGNVEVGTGNVEVTSGNVDVTSGNVQVGTGNVDVTSGNVQVGTGNVEITNGDVLVTNGWVDVTSGRFKISNGDLIMSNGYIQVQTGAGGNQIRLNDDLIQFTDTTGVKIYDTNAFPVATPNTVVNNINTAAGIYDFQLLNNSRLLVDDTGVDADGTSGHIFKVNTNSRLTVGDAGTNIDGTAGHNILIGGSPIITATAVGMRAANSMGLPNSGTVTTPPGGLGDGYLYAGYENYPIPIIGSPVGLYWRSNLGNITYPVAGPEFITIKHYFNGSAGSTTTFFVNSVLSLRWDAVNKQAQFNFASKPFGTWIDAGILFTKSTTTISNTDDINPTIGTWYYFTANGTLDTNFNHGNYGHRSECWLIPESGAGVIATNASTYRISVITGNGSSSLNVTVEESRNP